MMKIKIECQCDRCKKIANGIGFSNAINDTELRSMYPPPFGERIYASHPTGWQWYIGRLYCRECANLITAALNAPRPNTFEI